MKQSRALTFLVVCSLSAASQQAAHHVLTPSGNANTKIDLPVRVVDLTAEGKHIQGIPNTNSMGYPMRGASDGSVFVEMYDDSKQSPDFIVADLYEISEDAKVTKIQRKLPEHMDRIQVSYVYAGDSEIASLLSASPKPKSSDEPRSHEIEYFISLSKRDGMSEKLIPLTDLKFQPLKVAVLDSGRFFVAGVDKLNRTPVLAILDTDGHFLRHVTFDNRPLDNSKSLNAIYQNGGPLGGASGSAISDAAFVPFGNRVLFYIPGSKLPVRILDEGGEEDSVQLHLPDGYLIETILPCGKSDTWVVRTSSVKELAQLQSSGMVSNPRQQLFEVSLFNGETIRKLDIKGVYAGEVASAANKKLICLRQVADMQSGRPAVWLAVEQDR